MFSTIQTAMENNLDPYRYLNWLLKEENNADLADPGNRAKTAPLECAKGV